jgi:hypothetical protein
MPHTRYRELAIFRCRGNQANNFGGANIKISRNMLTA